MGDERHKRNNLDDQYYQDHGHARIVEERQQSDFNDQRGENDPQESEAA